MFNLKFLSFELTGLELLYQRLLNKLLTLDLMFKNVTNMFEINYNINLQKLDLQSNKDYEINLLNLSSSSIKKIEILINN